MAGETRGEPQLPLAPLFLVSLATLVFEICLTRLFSVVVHYNYVFLAVSIAICGLGIGASLVHYLQASGRGRPTADLQSACAMGFSITNLLSVVLYLRWILPHQLASQGLGGFVLLIPFGCAGAFFAAIFARHPRSVDRLYAADLIGAGSGAALVLLLLQHASPVAGCLAAAAVASTAAAMLARSAGMRLGTRGVSAVAWLLLGAHLAFGVLEVGPVFAAPSASGAGTILFEQLGGEETARPDPVHTEWNAVVRTDVVELPPLEIPGSERATRRYVFYMDGRNPTDMFHVDVDLRTVDPEEALRPMASSLPRTGRLAWSHRPLHRVLCIGPGGGGDVLLALLNGATEVVGAELNPSVVSIMGRFSEENGHLYDRANVRVETADGRAFVRRAERPFDLIFAAVSLPIGVGATTLMDSYLYTREAFRDYWEKLTPEGALAIIVHEPWMLKRFVATSVLLFDELGLPRGTAADHVAAVEGGWYSQNYLFVLRKAPMEAAEALRFRERAEAMKLRPLFVAGQVERAPYGPVLRGQIELERFVSGRIHDARPCTDDQPFCYDPRRGDVPEVLIRLVIGSVILVLGVIFVGAWARRSSPRSFREVAPFVAYFSLLGMGFMILEVALIQQVTRVLGFGVLALTLVLVTFLVGGGLGSLASSRLSKRVGGWGIPVAALAVAASVGGLRAGWEPVEVGLLALSLPMRLGAAGLGLAGLGFFLGMCFPLGLGALGRWSEIDLPWMWALNGSMSVVGSLAAIVVARAAGFSTVLGVGVVVYLLVALLGGLRVLRHGAR